MKTELFITYIIGPASIIGSFVAFFQAGQAWEKYHHPAVALMVAVALMQFGFGAGLTIIGMTRLPHRTIEGGKDL